MKVNWWNRFVCISIAMVMISSLSHAEGLWTSICVNNVYNDIVFDQNVLWGATTGGLVKWDTLNDTYEEYTVENGLAHDDVLCVSVDVSGVVWIGTSNGVSSFTGTNTTTYREKDGLVSNLITSIAVDSDSNVWFGSDKGVSKFDDETWTTYTESDGLVSNYVLSIEPDVSGGVWFGTAAGLSYFDGETWTNYTEADGLLHNRVFDIAIDSDDVKWLATQSGISRFDGETWSNRSCGKVASLAINTDGTIQLILGDWGVYQFNGESFSSCAECVGRFTSDNIKTAKVVIGSDGKKWYCTIDGVSCYDGEMWKEYLQPIQLADNRIWQIYIDSDMGKWFRTSKGLCSFKDNDWSMLYYHVRDVAFDSDGALWITSDDEMSKKSGDIWDNYIYHEEHVDRWGGSVDAVAVDKEGVVWVGGRDVLSFNGIDWHTYTESDGLVDDAICEIAVDNNNKKWFGTYEGISCFDGESWTTYTGSDGLVDYSINRIVVADDNTIWICTQNGVSCFNGETWLSYKEIDGLADNYVCDVAIDDNIKWFGTLNGVSRFDGETWTTFTTADGLISNNVYSVASDENGTVWFGTDKGISCLEITSVTDVEGDYASNPGEIIITSPYPNPFNPSTTISYTLTDASPVKLSVYNLTGQLVETLIDERQNAGTHAVTWQPQGLASGMYFYRIFANGYTSSGKMTLLK